MVTSLADFKAALQQDVLYDNEHGVRVNGHRRPGCSLSNDVSLKSGKSGVKDGRIDGSPCRAHASLAASGADLADPAQGIRCHYRPEIIDESRYRPRDFLFPLPRQGRSAPRRLRGASRRAESCTRDCLIKTGWSTG